ncbi:MAG: hypothetical protein Q8R37_05525 [Nanoarchaeota archaeon]|nr:hypothetical protein [Nanoarchaeota archaeon]
MADDLEKRSTLFAFSIKLSDASSGIGQLITGEALPDVMIQKLRWAGSMLAGVDNQSPYISESNLTCVEATTWAPYFYGALIQLGYRDRPSFLDNFYILLKSGGDAEITEDEIQQGKALLKRMSDDAFAELSQSTSPYR